MADIEKRGSRHTLEDWRPVFIAALRNSANVRAACQAAGINRMTAYRAREAFPDFAQEWNEVLEDAVDVLEAEARRRAMNGSDTMMIFLLKAHRPEKFREIVRQEHTGANGRPIEIRTLNVIPPVEAFEQQDALDNAESDAKG